MSVLSDRSFVVPNIPAVKTVDAAGESEMRVRRMVARTCYKVGMV